MGLWTRIWKEILNFDFEYPKLDWFGFYVYQKKRLDEHKPKTENQIENFHKFTLVTAKYVRF